MVALVNEVELITIEQAAEVFAVHPKTIERWIKKGALVSIQPIPRGKRFVSVRDIERLMQPKTL